MKPVHRLQKNLKSSGLSFDSKSTKVSIKVIPPKEYNLNKFMQFKKYQRLNKVKESKYIISFLHLLRRTKNKTQTDTNYTIWRAFF